jgi:hypothetical protein
VAEEVQRGDTGDISNPSLPQGEATALNENAAQGQAAASQIQDAADQGGQDQGEGFTPHDIEFAEPEKLTPAMPNGEADQMMFGPSDRPQEPITAGRAPVGYQAPPADINKWLGTLQDAVNDPDAPESLKTMFRLLVHHMQDQG